MRVALIDEEGALFSTAWKCLKDGADVLYLTEKKEGQKVGQGLVERAESLDEIVKWSPDVAVLYKVPKIAETLTKAKVPNVGSSAAATRLEDDRMEAIAVARKFGVGKVPESHEFKSFDDASNFVEESGKRRNWVFKVEGGSVDVSSTHVTKSTEHLMMVLEYEASLGRAKSFILQELVDGVEISIEGWFDYRRTPPWLFPINSTMEEKNMMAGGYGPMTGCMGSVVWAWPGTRPRLFRQTLEGLTPYLVKIEYVGPVDGNFIISYKDRQPYFLEFTPRLGWDAFEAVMHGLRVPVGEFFLRLAKGDLERVPMSSGYLGAVRVYAPHAKDLPIMLPLDEYRIYPKDVYVEEGQTRVVGMDCIPGFSCIAEATGSGRTVKQTMSEIYEEVIPQIVATDITFRNDIGWREDKELDILKSWGYEVWEGVR